MQIHASTGSCKSFLNKTAKSKEEEMKRNIAGIAIFILLIAFGCAETGSHVQTSQAKSIKTESVSKPQLYTAYNIWRVKSYLMRCINYKHGSDIIPAGTMVKKVEVVRKEEDYHPKRRYHIRFTTVEDNRDYKIDFTANWHPGKTAGDYKNFMITPKTFEELTEGMSENEIKAIKNATVVNGMSKRAVLASYGYPPEHKTSSLDSNIWVYWRNKMGTFNVCFDEDEKTTFCK
jgi:hypothetical protein